MIEISNCKESKIDFFRKEIVNNFSKKLISDIVSAFANKSITSKEYISLVHQIEFIHRSQCIKYSIEVSKLREKQELAYFIDDLVQKNNDGLIDDFIYENVMKRVKEQEKLIYILCVIKSFN